VVVLERALLPVMAANARWTVVGLADLIDTTFIASVRFVSAASSRVVTSSRTSSYSDWLA
jgi:hypothetical protein